MPALIMIVVYLLAILAIFLIKKDPSIGNFTWGGGVILLTVYSALRRFQETSQLIFLPRPLLASSLILLWGVRLIIYLFSRYKRGADPRFVEWLNQKGIYGYLWSFFWICLLQPILLFIMAYLPVVINLSERSDLGKLDLIMVNRILLGVCRRLSIV